KTAMDGGGYFTGIKAQPTESPIGYPLTLGETPLLAPPRTTSYCTGASYSAFIEGLNLWLQQEPAIKRDDLDTDPLPAWQPPFAEITEDRLESLRLQEPNGE